MIAFTCGGCGKLFQVDESLAGRRFRCKKCGTVATIPSTAVLPLLEVPAAAASAAEASGPRARRKRKRAGIGRDGWISLGAGFGLAVVALVIPLVGFVIDVLITVIHELGHVVTAWIFGSPALPSFDLSWDLRHPRRCQIRLAIDDEPPGPRGVWTGEGWRAHHGFQPSRERVPAPQSGDRGRNVPRRLRADSGRCLFDQLVPAAPEVRAGRVHTVLPGFRSMTKSMIKSANMEAVR